MHNHQKKLAAIWAKGNYPVDIYDVFIAHDDWCGLYSGKECNCDPDITIQKKVMGNGDK